MKKAKQFATEYQERLTNGESIEEVAKSIMAEFFDEALELIEQRGDSDEVIIGVLNQQHTKWVAFARRVFGIREDGFVGVLVDIHPDLAEDWPLAQQYIAKHQ